jgi:hypothetical protein
MSFYFPPILQLVSLYLKYSSFGRWEVMHVLQDIVKNNKEAKLRKWAEVYLEYGTWLVKARSAKNLALVTGLSAQIYEMSSTGDLKALLVIGLLIGATSAYIAAYNDWREGRDILTGTFASWASTAYRRDAGESLHNGLRFYLMDFDSSIQSGRRAENVARTEVLFTAQVSVLKTKDQRPTEYFSTLIAEYYEGYIGSSYEEQLFSDANQACANELSAMSEGHDSTNLHLLLTAIFQFAERSKEKGLDRFFNMPPAAYLIICQNNPSAHRWLLAEAVPETMSVLISEREQGPVQKRAYKALVECLIIGKQYGVLLPVTLRQTMKQHLDPIDGVDGMLDQILTPTISRKLML